MNNEQSSLNTTTEKSLMAVLIDFENIHASVLDNFSETPDWTGIVKECKKYGQIASIQAFGDWGRFYDELQIIQKNGIQPIFTPLSRNGKSSLDSYLIVSAMKLFFLTPVIDTLILASGDRDYIPLVTELKAMGKKIIVLSVLDALSDDLKILADDVIEIKPDEATHNMRIKAKKEYTEVRGYGEIKQKEEANKFIIQVIQELKNDSHNDRWVNLAGIGSKLQKEDSQFSHKVYGYSKLGDMLKDISGIELKYDNDEKTVALARTVEQKEQTRISTTESQTGFIHNLKEGFGFIRAPNDKEDNIFFHSSNVKTNFNDLKANDNVSYTTFKGARGLEARDIEKIS